MTSIKSLLAGLVAGAAIGGGGSMLLTDEPEQSPRTYAANAILDHATPECVAEIRLAENGCEDLHWCVTTIGGKDTEGWCCSGAFMGPREQKCLGAAFDAVPK